MFLIVTKKVKKVSHFYLFNKKTLTIVADAAGLFKGNLLKGNPCKVKDCELGAFLTFSSQTQTGSTSTQG